MATGADTPLLLCYDGSEPAKHAIERAAELAPDPTCGSPDGVAADHCPRQLCLGGRG